MARAISETARQRTSTLAANNPKPAVTPTVGRKCCLAASNATTKIASPAASQASKTSTSMSRAPPSRTSMRRRGRRLSARATPASASSATTAASAPHARSLSTPRAEPSRSNDRHSRAIAPGIDGVMAISSVASASIWAIDFSTQPDICGGASPVSAARAAPAATVKAMTTANMSRILAGSLAQTVASLSHVAARRHAFNAKSEPQARSHRGQGRDQGPANGPGDPRGRARERSVHRLLQIAVELVEELVGGEPRMIGADQDREVAGHVAAVHRVDANLFERLGKFDDVGRVVERAAILQPAAPGEDRGDRVGRGLLALLVLAIVPGDGAVRRLGLDRLAIRRQQRRDHHAERAEALRQRVGLHVAIIILAGPDAPAVPLQRQRDHVVD